jgi:hypothetical protein
VSRSHVAPVIVGTDGRGRSLAMSGAPKWGNVRISDTRTGASYVAWCPLACKTDTDTSAYLEACRAQDVIQMGSVCAQWVGGETP